MKKAYVLYHTACNDGWGAAYAAYRKLGDTAEYIDVQYGSPPPQMPDGSVVYILDFSYPREIIMELKSRMEKLVVLNHHATAEQQLKDIEGCYFDMTKSGAVMSWEYFIPTLALPILYIDIQDRDLGKFSRHNWENTYNGIRVLCHDFRDLGKYLTDTGYERLVATGSSITLMNQANVKSSLNKLHHTTIDMNGVAQKVAVINTTSLFTELGRACVEQELADVFIGWFVVSGENPKVVFSLRSKAGGPNMSEFAKTFPGGGGHVNAAGFSLDLSEGLEYVKKLLS